MLSMLMNSKKIVTSFIVGGIGLGLTLLKSYCNGPRNSNTPNLSGINFIFIFIFKL